jgi:uncharacterized protein YlaI
MANNARQLKVLVLICRKCNRMVDFDMTSRKRKAGKIVETYLSPSKCQNCGSKVSEKTCNMVQAGEA